MDNFISNNMDFDPYTHADENFHNTCFELNVLIDDAHEIKNTLQKAEWDILHCHDDPDEKAKSELYNITEALINDITDLYDKVTAKNEELIAKTASLANKNTKKDYNRVQTYASDLLHNLEKTKEKLEEQRYEQE